MPELVAETTAETPTSISLPIDTCPIQSVSVFVDRAEVTRHVPFNPSDNASSIFELQVQGLTDAADPDSIRVKVMKDDGKAPACVIEEVSFDIHHRPKNDSSAASAREAKAQASLEEARKEMAVLQAEERRIKEQSKLVQGYLQSMLMPSDKKSTVAHPVGTDLATVTKLLDFHAEQGAGSDAKLLELAELIKQVQAKQTAAESELKEIKSLLGVHQTVASRDVSVLVSLPEPTTGSVTLSMTYLVKRASWKPSYDLRVGSIANPSMALTYFGVVRQNTGEDWSNVKLSLSTASPSAGGTPPMPPTLTAHLRTKYPEIRAFGGSMTNAMVPMQSLSPAPERFHRARMAKKSDRRRTSLSSAEAVLQLEEEKMEDVRSVSTAAVTSGAAGSANFQIQRQSSVASDNKEHKVTIAILDLTPKIRYFAVPKLEESAYLQTTTTNTSNYPLLPSSSVAIFVEGSFVTKSAIKHTSPGESFIVFLGVDPSLKVEHRQLQDVTSKGKEGKMFSGKQPSQRDLSYMTLLHNTKTTNVELTLVDCLPKTNDSRIEIELLQPARSQLKQETPGAASSATGEGELLTGRIMQNKMTNNIVHNLNLTPGQKLEVPFSYSIKYPHNEHAEENIVIE